ncbi:hypothetical protein [Pseudomonas sp.]|uniref:hypothetical protein n=1 Tax=Pseudomonas sp. TaxID=306 RepID=UPI00257FAB10|nr:hypothetical protein [Pseudomonas sp.]
MRTLKTPINRLGFVVFIAGATMILVSLWGGIDWVDYTGKFRVDLPSARELFDFNYPYRIKWWQPFFRWGCAFAFVGAWLAWLFSPTIGRLVRWIRRG